MKNTILLLIIFITTTIAANAQFPIKIPKIKTPKIEVPKTNDTTDSNEMPSVNNPVKQNISSSVSGKKYDRQMLMDDGFTYFDAEVVTEYDSSILGHKDIGWYLKSHLRLLGTFPERSAFRIAVKKNGKQLYSVRCEGEIKSKAKDDFGKNDQYRQKYPMNYDDYIKTGFNCSDEKSAVKEIGEMKVEVYFINGDTDAEKLVRTYKIDVHKETNVRGNASKPQKDVSSYYIQRHAEAANAFAYFEYGRDGLGYFSDPIERTFARSQSRTLHIYTTFSPEAGKSMPRDTFARCSVNGQRLNFESRRDSVRVTSGGRNDEIGTYTDRLIPKYQRGNPYTDKIIFRDLVFQMPLYTGGEEDIPGDIKIENHPGDWECKIMANGENLRTFRWTVADGRIVSHAEQQSGNVNLFYDAGLVEMEIPTGGASFDYRLTPMPNAELFYGIPWTSADGKKRAAGVPKKGNPYAVPSTEANK